MFENSEVGRRSWKVSPRIGPWIGLPGAFASGVLTGLLWAGALPRDTFRIVCLAALVGWTILSVILYTRRLKTPSNI